MLPFLAERTRPGRRPGSDAAAEKDRVDGFSELELAVQAASLVESSGDAVISVSPSGLIESWGQGAERMFGYTPQETIGQHIRMLATPERADEPFRFRDEALAGRTIKGVETERLAKSGRRLRVLISLSPVTDRHGEPAGILGLYRDITAQREAEAHLKDSERRYQSVVEALSEGVVMQDRNGRILAFNENAALLLELAPEALEQGVSTPVIGSLVDEDGSELAPDGFPGFTCLSTGEPQRGVIVGVKTGEEVRRWLSVNSTPLFDPGWREPHGAVTSLTDVTAHRRTIRELQLARLEDLERLALVAEYRDDETFRHTERVGRLAECIASELGLDPDVAWMIRRAAPLHDVGKIGIPDDILLKPERLTVEEFEVIKTHTTIGQRILANSHAPILRMASEIAATHHERWDGTGYPAGMRGAEIPIAGRIVAIVDAFDAMTHDRPYRTAVSRADAIAEIERCRGSHFDEDVVDAFMRADHARPSEPDA